MALFAHPIIDQTPSGRDEANLQFFGHYSARNTEIGNDWSNTRIHSFVNNLPSNKEGKRGSVKEGLWLKAHGCIMVNFGFTGIDNLDICSSNLTTRQESPVQECNNGVGSNGSACDIHEKGTLDDNNRSSQKK